MKKDYYKEGVEAQQSNDPEPKCGYEPGGEAYRLFANGFCHDIERKKKEVDLYE